MSNFNFKSIFIKEESVSPEEKKSEPKASSNEKAAVDQFPDKSFSPKPTPTYNVSISDGILNQVLDVYEKGFDSLNTPGYDFYEFFKALHSVNDFSSNAYKMAFQMGKAMNSALDKNALVSSADFYLNEISKVYENYKQQGESKKNEILKTQTNERNSISNEITSLENQITSLKNQIRQLEDTKRSREGQLIPIDSKYQPELKIIEEKLQANNSAKDIISDKINTVKRGLLTNI
jgi:hypothetical protein